MPSIVAMLAGWRLREVLNVKIGLPITNVYAGLKRTILVLCGHPTAPMIMPLKLPRGLSKCLMLNSRGIGNPLPLSIVEEISGENH